MIKHEICDSWSLEMGIQFKNTKLTSEVTDYK